MLARFPRPVALLVLLGLLLGAGWCLSLKEVPLSIARKPGQYTDMRLYHDIVTEMGKGTPYHQAAAQLHREHHYPLKPFFTMRLPTLSEVAVRIGWKAMQPIALALLLAGIFAWVMALKRDYHWSERVLAAVAIGTGGSSISSLTLMAMHEVWTGLFLSLALAIMVGWPRLWPWALVAAGCALSIRELALPFALLALAFALAQRHWREAAGWSALIALFAAGMALHAAAAMPQVLPGDIKSAGWNAVLGLPGFMSGVIHTSVLQKLPKPLAHLAVILPMFGWLAAKGRGGLFALLLFCGYALMMALFSRPDNFYWGAMVLPAYFIGFALLPRFCIQMTQKLRPAAIPPG